MGKTLTPELINQKCKTDKIYSIKNLNLWGNDLEDISIIQEMPNIEICSLSLNKIISLKDFSTCKKLTELYLRKNLISELQEVKYLT
jgi:Leucine-rich repeat (LRR) protein